MNREILWALSALSIAGALSPAAAQNPTRVQVTPTFGVYIPTNDIGPAAPGGGAWYIQLDQVDAAPSFGLGIQIPLAGPVLGARVHALATLPADAAGVFNCYPGLACPAVFMASTAEV